ncbi:hypothetical protein C8Q75DRAFT_362902 [Abortiporus biennis]|nr:hypothetical protein C8Q75DRAFT_362902 [Abortiporus biennis]
MYVQNEKKNAKERMGGGRVNAASKQAKARQLNKKKTSYNEYMNKNERNCKTNNGRYDIRNPPKQNQVGRGRGKSKTEEKTFHHAEQEKSQRPSKRTNFARKKERTKKPESNLFDTIVSEVQSQEERTFDIETKQNRIEHIHIHASQHSNNRSLKTRVVYD